MGTRASSSRAAALRTRKRTADTATTTFYNLLVADNARVFNVAETASPDPGNGGLKMLKAVPNLIGDKGIVPKGSGAENEDEDRRNRGHHVLESAGGCDRAGVQSCGDRLLQAG